jgi:hypothetical protein
MVVASGQARLELRRDPKTPVARNDQKLSTERTERIRRRPMRLRSAGLADLLPVYGERMMRDGAGARSVPLKLANCVEGGRNTTYCEAEDKTEAGTAAS